MKQCCNDASNEHPSGWQKWKSRVIYFIVVSLLVVIALIQFFNV